MIPKRGDLIGYPSLYGVDKMYVDRQSNIVTEKEALEIVLKNFSEEQIIEMIGVEKVQVILRKMKIKKIKNK